MAANDTTLGGVGQPANHAAAVTPSDLYTLTDVSRAIYVGGTGDLVAVMLGGETVTFSAIPVGTVLPIRVQQVKSTGTTASLIVNLW